MATKIGISPPTSLPAPGSAVRSWNRLSTVRRRREFPLILSLVILDAVSLWFAFALAYLLRFRLELLPYDGPHTLAFYSSVGVWAVPMFLAIMAAYRLYKRRYLF